MSFAALADVESWRRHARAEMASAARGDHDAPVAQDAVPLRVKAVGGRPLHVRPRSNDIDMIWCTYARTGICRPTTSGVLSRASWSSEPILVPGSPASRPAIRLPRSSASNPIGRTPRSRAGASRTSASAESDAPADWPCVRAVSRVGPRLVPARPLDRLRVQSIRVESEREYGSDPVRCGDAMRRLGFESRIEPHSWGAFVFGVRR